MSNKRFSKIDANIARINQEQFTSQSSTPAAPSAGDVAFYNKTDGNFYAELPSGSELPITILNGANGSIRNYIANHSGLISTTGYAAYADAASSSPVDGTGGSPTVTITQNTTTPIRNAADLLINKSASNLQGNGISYDFTIDSADQSRPMKWSFDYKASANFSYANNDLVLYIYDKTNTVLIQPTPYTLDGSGRAVVEFQTNAGSTSYRVIWHIATTNASAWTFEFTNVVVNNNTVQPFCTLQDTEYNLVTLGVISGTSSASFTRAVAVPYKTKDGTWRIKLNVGFTCSSVGNVNITISGANFNTAYNSGGQGQALAAESNAAGEATGNITSGTVINCYSGGNAFSAYWFSGDVECSAMPTWAVDYYPVQLSNGAETRVVGAFYNGNPSNLPSGGTLIYSNKIDDTHSAYNVSNGQYIIPVSGKYNIAAGTNWYRGDGGTYSGTISILKNGSSISTDYRYSYPSGNTICSPKTAVSEYPFTVGDIVTITGSFSTGGGANYDGSSNFFSISRVSGPATIAASEKVYAEYNSVAGQSFSATGSPSGGGGTLVNFDNKVIDTHNAVTTGASWKFTAPRAGYYHLDSAMMPSVLMANSCEYGININKNNSFYKTLGGSYVIDSRAISFVSGSTSIYLNAGDYINLYFYSSNTSGTFEAYNGSNGCSAVWITIYSGN